MPASAKARCVELQRGFDIGEHKRGGAVGNERAISALERPGNERIFVALGAAEIIAEILAELRVRIANTVFVVLGGDAGERIRLIAPALEIQCGDLAEDAGEAAVDIGFFPHIGCLEQIASDLRGRRRGHLLDADHEHDAGGASGDRFKPLMHGGGAGSAGILDPGGALEAQIG